ncbi:hypothetical protein [Stomatohabitans albus]|uniref:hypothetical protein n=1 Tax=Stomatohabitans albus TaxID=3110766 RepID=UPI00300C25F9
MLHPVAYELDQASSALLGVDSREDIDDEIIRRIDRAIDMAIVNFDDYESAVASLIDETTSKCEEARRCIEDGDLDGATSILDDIGEAVRRLSDDL